MGREDTVRVSSYAFTSREVRFRAPRGGEGQLTFGQYFMWDILDRLSPHEDHTNLLTGIEIADPVHLDQVLAGIERLVIRHESLRTCYRVDEHGEPRQVLIQEGMLTVRIVDVRGQDFSRVATECAADLRATWFDLARDLPIRITIFTEDSTATGMLIYMSHMASDVRGMQVIRQDVTELLKRESADLPPAGRQPLDQARHEQSPDARSDESSALELWRSRLRRFPETMFESATGRVEEPRYWEGSRYSPAIRLAAEAIAQRADVSVPAVICTAVSFCLARAAGRQECALTIRVMNRLDADTDDAVGHFTEDMAVYLDLRHDSFEDVAMEALVAAIEAYRFGRYHLSRLRDVLTEIDGDRGTKIRLDTMFDCTPLRAATELELRAGALSRDELRAALLRKSEESSFRWQLKRSHEIVTCFVRSWDDELNLLADTAYLTPELVEQILRGVERLLIGIACQDGDARELMRESGIPLPEHRVETTI